MAILLALVAAATFGTSDFIAGLASRRLEATAVTGLAAVLATVTAAVAVLFFSGDGLTGAVAGWGAVAGVGSMLGTLSLYHGLAVGRMSVVATLSGLIAAVVPAIVGILEGDGLSALQATGIAVAIPAIALVSWQPRADEGAAPAGARWGVLAGIGFALLFVGLARAGTASGAWPLVIAEAAAAVLIAPFAVRALAGAGRGGAREVRLAIAVGVLAGLANLAFLAATGHGELAIVAILTSLYPGATVVLARVVLGERWSRLQVIGLSAALIAVVLVSAGSA